MRTDQSAAKAKVHPLPQARLDLFEPSSGIGVVDDTPQES